VGLLFVSVSLYRGRDQPFPAERLKTAERSFGDFLYVLMIGLVFLVPHEAPIGLAVALLVLGTARGAGLIRQATGSRRGTGLKSSSRDSLREYAMPAFASVGLIVVGIEAFLGNTISIYGLVLVIAALLITGSWNAWLLLTQP